MTIKPDQSFASGTGVIVEPRVISKTYMNFEWPPPQLGSISAEGSIILSNETNEILSVHKNDHLCQIFAIKSVPMVSPSKPSPKTKQLFTKKPYSALVQVDPDNQLSDYEKDLFVQCNLQFDELFEPVIGRYNDAAGKVRARVNIGKVVPPSRKLQVPCYDRNNLQALQDKFDDLESEGVFARPEDVNVVVEHVSPSFLVKKSSGGHRLVTAFTSLGQFCKTLPVTMPTIDSVFRMMGSWRYFISTDLRDAFYQIPLEHSSMKWCGTPTPFRGLRVYTVAAQGMPGSSESLEEMLCTVLGSLVKEGWVAKIADDLNVGGGCIPSLLRNWTSVMSVLYDCGLRLKAVKTIICPLHAQVLGWDWHDGKLAASKHRISTLSSCEPPTTVTAMRSFIGAYKTFNKVVKRCTSYLSSLEEMIVGKQKQDGLQWSDSASSAFKSAQLALENTPSISLPRPTDELLIVHDGSNIGIGSIMFVKRDDELSLGSYFSAKLKVHHQKWLPCEIEALSITASINHFSPLLRESRNVTQILTDSRPCVQSWNKMLRGEFSTSARVATFLSTLAQYNVELQHLKGSSNLPSDFQSRNPPMCVSGSCQICKFVSEISDSVVRRLTVEDILAGRAQVPYSNKGAWREIQQACQDLKRVFAYLSAGTRPTPRTKMTDVKRYLQKASIDKDGLLIVPRSEPFLPRKELIIVPQQVVLGFMTSLHLKLNHPTKHQLLQVFNRNFFALKSDHFSTRTLENCDLCQSLKSIPKELHVQSSIDLPTSPCRSFAADVINRFRQKIYVLVDTFSSYTFADLIPSDDAETLRNILCQSISILRPSPQTVVLVRSDNASGFKALVNDLTLTQLNIVMDYGRRHNKNKNPVVDKVISELISELLRINPVGGQTNTIELSHAVNQLNSRIRGRGLSSWEVVSQRDADTGVGLDINDEVLSQMQKTTRVENQIASAKNKSNGGALAKPADISVGSLVYIKDDKSKLRGRERYIVVEKQGSDCTLKKLLKSTLRNQNYKLKTTEIYPVSSNIVRNESYLRGWDHLEEDDEGEDEWEGESSDNMLISHGHTDVVIPAICDDGPLQCADTDVLVDSTDIPVDDVEVTQSLSHTLNSDVQEDLVSLPAVVPPSTGRGAESGGPSRRGGRTKKSPSWHKDYDMK